MGSPRTVGPEAFLPLRPAAYLLLLGLAEGDGHAYALKQDVARRSGGRVRLGPATLHRTLADLADKGLIEESPARPDPDRDDERRRYYRLTPLGRKVAIAETNRLADLVAGARALGWARRGGSAR